MDFIPEYTFTDTAPPPALPVAASFTDDFAPFDFTEGARVLGRDTPEERRLMTQLKLQLGHAKDKARKRDERVYKDRQAFDLDEKIQEYEGQPNITMSGTRSKTKATSGHILATIDQSPLLSATSYTPEAEEIAPIYETAMERELKLANSRQRILETPLEAATVGTAIVGFELVTRASGELAVQVATTRLENFYCYPVAVDDFSKSTTFRRFKLPYWELKEMAQTGLYDMAAVEAISGSTSGDNLTKEEGDDNSGGDTLFDENRMVELYEAFYRYTPERTLYSQEEPQATLYQVIFTEQHTAPLALRENPYDMAFDAPPFVPLRLDKKAGYVWGTSIPTLLRAGQKILDDSMNDVLAYNQLARTPVIEADTNSSLYRTYQDGFRPRPGDILPRRGPQNSGITAIQFPQPVNAMNEMAMAKEEMDQATFTDHLLRGENYAQGRRTKYEVQSAYGSGAITLKDLLRTLSTDMELFARYFWAMVDAYKVEPEGIYSVYKDGATALLSTEGIDAATLQAELMPMVPQLLQDPEVGADAAENIYLNPQTQEVVQLGNIKLVNGGVPSTRRDDISFSLTGTAISTDKQATMGAFQIIGPFMGMLPAAKQDTSIWHIFKSILEASGIKGYEKWLGQDPMVTNVAAFQQGIAAQQAGMQASSIQ